MPIDTEVRGIFPPTVDNSMRKTLVRCEKMAYWKHERGLVPVTEQRVHLEAGKAFAAGVCAARRAYYGEGVRDYGDLLQTGLRAIRAAYHYTGPQPPYCFKTVDRVESALAFYLSKWPLETETLVPVRLNDGRLGIELCESMPIPIQHPVTNETIHFVANFDMLVQDTRTGTYWVVDEKTTGKMGDTWALQWTLDAQLTGYCFVARRMLRMMGDKTAEVAGAIIRGVSFLKADHAGMECMEYRQPWELDRWYYQMMRDMNRWVAAHRNGYHDMVMDHACALYNSPCEYSKLCKANDPERLIEGSYVVKHYDPSNRED